MAEPSLDADPVHGRPADSHAPSYLGDGEEQRGLSVAHRRRTAYRAKGSDRCHAVESGRSENVRHIEGLRTGATGCHAVVSLHIRLGCKWSVCAEQPRADESVGVEQRSPGPPQPEREGNRPEQPLREHDELAGGELTLGAIEDPEQDHC